MDTVELTQYRATSGSSQDPTFGEMCEETLAVVGVIPVAGPPLLFIAGPLSLVALLLVGPLAVIATLAVVLAAVTALMLLAAALIASPFLLVRSLRTHARARAASASTAHALLANSSLRVTR